MVHKVLERYIKWDSMSTKAGFIPVTKGLMKELLDKVPEKEVAEIAQRVERLEFADIAIMFRNEFNLESFFDVIETRARVSGFPYRYSVKGKLHSITIQHDLGSKWSTYLSARYRAALEDLGVSSFKFRTAPNTIQFEVFEESQEK